MEKKISKNKMLLTFEKHFYINFPGFFWFSLGELLKKYRAGGKS